MLRTPLILGAVIALHTTAAAAESFVEDAFGIVPETSLTPERASWSGLRSVGGRTETLPPRDAQTVLIFAGAKSLVAGKDVGHAVALVLDPHGNLAADDIGVVFTIAGVQRENIPLEHGLADVLFQPGTKAGTFSAGAAFGPVQSARALFRVTTDLGSVTPVLAQNADPLVPETFSGFVTTPLRDRFGNQVEDGVALGFVLAHDDGSASLMTGLARDGSAGARLLARDMASGGALSATLAANGSRDLGVELVSLASAQPVEIVAWPVPELDAMAVRVGPLTTSAGHLMTDGAPVTLTVETAEGARDSRSGWLRDGYYEELLPLSPGGAPIEATVESPLGREAHAVTLTDAPTNVRGAE